MPAWGAPPAVAADAVEGAGPAEPEELDEQAAVTIVIATTDALAKIRSEFVRFRLVVMRFPRAKTRSGMGRTDRTVLGFWCNGIMSTS